MTDKPLAEDTETSDDSFLNGQIQVRQPRSGYRIGTDAVMVAATIQMKAGRLLDMGAGVGGISLAIAHRLADAQITAAEIDPVNYALLSHNIGIMFDSITWDVILTPGFPTFKFLK